MTDDEVHSAVVRWLKSVTGKTVIKAYQSAKRPAGQYITVNLTGFYELHEHAQEVVYTGDDEVAATPVIEVEWRFSTHAYGPQPTAILRPVISARKLAQVTEPLMPGLVLHDVSQIRHVPEFVNNAWEPRAQMDINLRGLVKDGHVIDVIEQTTFVHERF
ncbi:MULTISPECIES: phage neck terminator protein [unclassified Shinella]|uniref:phage neck terminator protein n=1 Tax=unclassified Shinella TaxID=2643062 RepID=UPI00234E8BBA|nr:MULTISPECIES: hypothetical protein [unclassified Shinella]MCO5152582.1 hypothetical protein [Shinella sp.]MDC7261877.1 hypothetical protein [Shinella sp. HY16]MDC7268772.1 hypothetical protein [Shinella sp. YZ44]